MAGVLITGAASGFGYLAALALARRGERVFATVRDLSGHAEDTIARVAKDEGLALSVHQMDVTDSAEVERVISELVGSAGGFDVLVNNAGFGLRGPLEAISDAEMLKQFDTNVFGILRTIRAVVPHMRRRRSGTIINVSSLTGFVGSPFQGAYSATKHAVEAMSEALRFELASSGIHVVVIEPGSYDTGFASNTRHATAFGPEHPLWAEYQGLFAAWQAMRDAGRAADPAEVIEEIRAAIDNPGLAFRRQVGDDAKLLYELKRQHSHEEFEGVMRRTLGLIPAEPTS